MNWLIGRRARFLVVVLLACGLQACGVSKITTGEEEVISEWRGLIAIELERPPVILECARMMEPIDGQPSVETTTIIVSGEALTAYLNTTFQLADKSTFLSLSNKIARLTAAAKAIATTASTSASGATTQDCGRMALARLEEIDKRVWQKRQKYVIAARTHNDILRTFRLTTMVMGRDYAMTYADGQENGAGPVTMTGAVGVGTPP